MYGFITKGNHDMPFYIKVEGYPELGYGGYTVREAIRQYRRTFDLVFKHIEFIDCRR